MVIKLEVAVYSISLCEEEFLIHVHVHVGRCYGALAFPSQIYLPMITVQLHYMYSCKTFLYACSRILPASNHAVMVMPLQTLFAVYVVLKGGALLCLVQYNMCVNCFNF